MAERPPLRGALMVCGTTSDAGKSTLVAGLCRLLARQGVRVAPFKAQNMALNSAVTVSGHEIGRAQYLQAEAAQVEAEVAMNPILLKPTNERAAQVVLRGRSIGTMTAAEYHQHKPALWAEVCRALADLRRRFDVVLVEGAGSPAEINLLDHDIVNLRVAHEAGMAALVVGDIDRGGVFAALYGTVALLPDHLAACVQGFVINRFRGDPALLADGPAMLEHRCGVPTLGVVPYLDRLDLDPEDSLALARPSAVEAGAVLDVAVVALPHLANFTDFDALSVEAGVGVRYVRSVGELGRPHLVVLPGSKATVADLGWLRAHGLDRAIWASGAEVLGICAGYQMLGERIADGVESEQAEVAGLGWLPVTTRFEPDKVLRRGVGQALGCPLTGYQIHHGRVAPVGPVGPGAPGGPVGPVGPGGPGGPVGAAAGAAPTLPAEPWLTFAGASDGIAAGRFRGATVHGLFDADGFRRTFLRQVAERAGVTLPERGGPPYSAIREGRLERLADVLEAHLDLPRVWDLIAAAG